MYQYDNKIKPNQEKNKSFDFPRAQKSCDNKKFTNTLVYGNKARLKCPSLALLRCKSEFKIFELGLIAVQIDIIIFEFGLIAVQIEH